jgi:hypothetical protein
MPRAFILVMALPCLGVTCGPGLDPPPPDACTDPSGAPPALLAIGPTGDPFVAWAAADQARVTVGSQGGAMIGVRMRVAGAGGCLAERTTVSLGGQVLASEETPVHTYPDAAGDTFTTETLWLVFDGPPPQPGQTVDVVTEAGGLSAGASLTIAP